MRQPYSRPGIDRLMTLVAGLSFGGTPTFVGDILTSWRLPTKISLPTRLEYDTYQSADGSFAADLAQKLIIVRPYLLIAWTGTVSIVHELVCQLDNILPVSMDDLRGREELLLEPLDRVAEGVELLAVVIDDDWVRPFCIRTRGFEADGKRIYLLGSGSEAVFNFLLEMTRDMPTPDNSDGIAARAVMINFAGNALMAQHVSKFGLDEAWGGGFEVAYVTKDGFKKVDNILVRCWSLNSDGSLGNVGASFVLHYEGPSLLISSFGAIERTTVIRSPIDKAKLSLRPKTIFAQWTVDLFFRPSDGRHFCAIQYEYPWSGNRSSFSFKNGNIVGWNMSKARVDKIIAKITSCSDFPPFEIHSF